MKVAASTPWEILKNAGIDPAPRRTGPTWSQLLRSQADAILACDFFTTELLDGTQAYVLAVIEHATRRIRILGITRIQPENGPPSRARNLIMDLGEQAHLAAARCWTAPLSGIRAICGGSCVTTRCTTISNGRTAPCTAPRR